MPDKKYQSFAITVRPRGGVPQNGEYEKRFLKWLSKIDYAVCVAEMSDARRHLHAQIWHNDPRPKSSIAKTIERISAATIPDWDAAQRVVQFGKKGDKNHKGGLRIAYNDWYNQYLLHNPDKDEPAQEDILVNRPPEDTTDFYPSQEEQEKVKNKARAVDYKYHALAERYAEWCEYKECEQEPVTYEKVAYALTYSMFKAKSMCVLKDTKTMRNTCQNLTWYLQSQEEPQWMYGYEK